jgi:N-acyl-D-amino-acid deacylase
LSIDLLLKDGLVINGSENGVPFKADVALENDLIKAVGDLSHVDAKKTINIKGLCVCPGFIDAHSHSEFTLLADGRAEGKINQGVTAEINGNCGMSAAPLYGDALEHRDRELEELGIKERWNTFDEYFALLEKKQFALNFVTLTGHGNLRASVKGYSDEPLKKIELNKMIDLLRSSLEQGSKGMSTGLIYPPGVYSDTREIISLAHETAGYNGIYTTHMRSEGDELVESIEEVLKIAEESGVHAHISHLKTSDEKNWNKLENVLNLIDTSQKAGSTITCDRYPYIASSTDLDAVLPSWAYEGGRKKEISRLIHERTRLSKDILRKHPDTDCWQKVFVSSVNMDRNKWMEGKSLADIAETINHAPLTCLFDLLIEEELMVGAIFFVMNESNLTCILKQRYTMIGSDSSARSFNGITSTGKPHPRGFGSFPRILGRYVKEQRVLSLEEAVYKMTGLPARTFRMDRRGMLMPGYYADITIFDPETVLDTADFTNPFQRPEGIHHVFINGSGVLLDGEPTGAMPGRIIR